MKTHYRLYTSALCGRSITATMKTTVNMTEVDCKSCLKKVDSPWDTGSDSGERDLPSLEEIAEQEPLPVIPRVEVIAGKAVITAAEREQAAQDFATEALERVAAATPQTTREAWLVQAVEILTEIFTEHGHTVPAVRISVGWPGGKGPKAMLKTIGQCWYGHQAKDGLSQIFISPNLDDPAEILATIAHELVHAVAGATCGHRGAFRKIALQIGLEGKMTATHAGDVLKAKFPEMLDTLGKYDHAKLTPSTKTKPGNQNRHLKIECQHCAYGARSTRKQMDMYGMPSHCGEEMYEA